ARSHLPARSASWRRRCPPPLPRRLPSPISRTTLFFFFQAEDGIRDLIVTGVQTCALPIWNFLGDPAPVSRRRSDPAGPGYEPDRSEERRVGKECSARGSGDGGKKKEGAGDERHVA